MGKMFDFTDGQVSQLNSLECRLIDDLQMVATLVADENKLAIKVKTICTLYCRRASQIAKIAMSVTIKQDGSRAMFYPADEEPPVFSDFSYLRQARVL